MSIDETASAERAVPATPAQSAPPRSVGLLAEARRSLIAAVGGPATGVVARTGFSLRLSAA